MYIHVHTLCTIIHEIEISYISKKNCDEFSVIINIIMYLITLDYVLVC